jgi:hypothetical protein
MFSLIIRASIKIKEVAKGLIEFKSKIILIQAQERCCKQLKLINILMAC